MTTSVPVPVIDLDEPIYSVNDRKKISMRELLNSFQRHGTQRVTDLHLKVGSPPTYRADGALKQTHGQPLDEQTILRLAGTLLTQTELETMEELRSVNSSSVIDGLRYRVNAFHDRRGPAVAIRALDVRMPTVEMVGFPNAVWEDIVRLQQGLVLLTGTTGAGKSTTIAALLNYIAKTRPVHVITLEDPIEYEFESSRGMISQRAVGRDVPSYERGLRDCLREDPDVIFVGEMTDAESAAWTLTAAETGHLVFSGLHTRDASGTVSRLMDMFPEYRAEEVANQMSLSLRYILSQKLLPRADRAGRVVAMEILNNNFAVANVLRQGRSEQLYSIMQTQTRDVSNQRMQTLERSLADLVRSGVVELADAERAANKPPVLEDDLKNG